MGSKFCTKCGVEKELREFRSSTKSEKVIYRADCRVCECDARKKFNKENRLRLYEKQKVYRQQNKDKVKLWATSWRNSNKEKKAEFDKEYRGKNKDKIRARKKEYQLENRVRISDRRKELYDETKRLKKSNYDKKYVSLNRDKIRKKQKLYNTRSRDELKNNYVKAVLRTSNTPITPEIIELKREQLTVLRLKNKLKEYVKEKASSATEQ